MATIYIQDTFTEGSDVELSLHTPDIGGAWSKHPSFSTSATVVASEDRLRGDSSTASSLYINATAPATDDYKIEWTARQTTVGTGSRAGAVGRYNATTNNGYNVYYDGTQWILVSVVSGTATELAAWDGSETVNTDYAIRWTMLAGVHEVFFDGVLRIRVTDTTFLSAGRSGILCRLNGRIDNFTVSSLDVGNARSEQQPTRVVSTTDPKARAEQVAVRVISTNKLNVIVEQVPIRVVSENVPNDAGGRRRLMTVTNG